MPWPPRTGGPVALFGHSYGGGWAPVAAARSSNVHHLVLYEPSLGLSYPPGSIGAIERAISAGELEPRRRHRAGRRAGDG